MEVRTPLAVRFGEEDREIVELTSDQAWILSFVAHRKRAAVTGPAGAGKTLLAVQLSKRLAAEGLRTLLTCFSRRLGQYLRASTEGVEGVDVGTFHDLCVRMAKEAGFALPERSGQLDSDLLERELPELLERAARTLGPRYDAIVVDEAQDFRERWWPALLALHRDPDDGMFYLFADEDLAHLLAVVLGDLVREERVPLGDIVVLTPAGKANSRLRSRGSVDGFRLSDEPESRSVLATSIQGFGG